MKAYKSILAYFFLMFGSSIILNIINSYILNFKYLPIYDDYYSFSISFQNLISYVLIAGVLILLNYNDLFNDVKRLNYKSIIKIIIGFICIFLASFLMAKLFPTVSSNQSTINKMYSNKPLLILHACLLAPLCEEIIFRKSIHSLIKNPTLFILISGILFGFIHCLSGDFINIIKYAVPGFVFSILYLYDKNTISNYIIHLLYNLIIILLA